MSEAVPSISSRQARGQRGARVPATSITRLTAKGHALFRLYLLFEDLCPRRCKQKPVCRPVRTHRGLLCAPSPRGFLARGGRTRHGRHHRPCRCLLLPLIYGFSPSGRDSHAPSGLRAPRRPRLASPNSPVRSARPGLHVRGRRANVSWGPGGPGEEPLLGGSQAPGDTGRALGVTPRAGTG